MKNNEAEAVKGFVKDIAKDWNLEDHADNIILIGKNQGAWTVITSDPDGSIMKMAEGYDRTANELDHCYIADTKNTNMIIKFDHPYEEKNEN